MFKGFEDFSTMNVENIAKELNAPSVVQPQSIEPVAMANDLLFPKPKPEVRIEDFYPEAKVYVGLLDNGLRWGLPVLLKKIYNIPTEEECEHQFQLHQSNYTQFRADYEAFGAIAESEQDELQKAIFEKTKMAYEEADRVWTMYPLIKKSVEQKGLDQGENKLLERALATWLYQNRDKVQNPLITIAVVVASSVGSRFAELELTGAKQFRPLVVDELGIKQQISQNYADVIEAKKAEPNPDSGRLLDESIAKGE